MKSSKQASPFIKWAGGKSRLAPTIEESMLERIDIQGIDTYIEPFVGGGSFFFYLTQKYYFKKKIICDVNEQLINLYKVIKNKPYELIEQAAKLQNEYNLLEGLEYKSIYYYDVRKRFNESITSNIVELNVLQATDFLFLNKIGFNGLYRVNKKGLFNVPFGKRETASLFNSENIIAVSEVLLDTTILHCDYQETIKYVSDKALYYLDPPYRPLSTSSSFTSYAKSDFNDTNQIKLAEFCHEVDKQGAKFLLSNSDPKNSDIEDNFFDTLYSNYQIKRINASRMIGAKSASRGKVSEILVVNK